MKKLVCKKENFVNKKGFINKKMVISLSVVIFLSLSALLFFKFHKKKLDISFDLIGNKTIELEVFDKYKEEGFKLVVNEKNITNNVKIINNINLKKIGIYKVIYSYIDENKITHELIRNVKIVDKTAPVITLNGNAEINILKDEEYVEPGFEVSDNYDKDLQQKVEIEGEVNTKVVGEYELKYKVSDSSGNSAEVSRKVIVNRPKPKIVYTETKAAEKSTNVNNVINNTTNTITKNKFTSSGIYYEGYVKNSNGSYKLKLVNEDNEVVYDMTPKGENNFSGEVNLTTLNNGVYKVNVISASEESLLNKLESIDKIVRAKVGDKLITLNYDNNNVSITIDDFNYQYDILIDAGHGGSDPGASNAYIYEKDMNLKVSMYEKCRYEEHGLNVFMIRTNDSYGVMLGDNSWRNLSKRGYSIGYYGSVSKIVYSNHHNSSVSTSLSGYEILTPSKYDNINSERNIAAKFNSIYPLTESHRRIYARDYDSEVIYSTANGEQYSNIRDYYAIIRMPYELFNTKVVIYEGAYMSNNKDYDWYWNNENWKKVSEIKINEYVSSLGKSYDSNTSCS